MNRSNDEQELSSVYQFITVLYNLHCMVALRSRLYGKVASGDPGLKEMRYSQSLSSEFFGYVLSSENDMCTNIMQRYAR